MKFKLSDSFIEKYKEVKPNWGPLGEFIYLRTYSRFIEEENRNEVWWETVKRVVEGTFNVQKEHCAKLRLPWKNPKAQNSAQIMFDKIFNFKFLPSGRGLWMMGSNFVEERGGAALASCAFVTTEDIVTRGAFAFCWSFDALMCGVGVGFDTKGAGKVAIREPKPADDTLIYTIPDSREGWVESLELVLDSFFFGKKMPKFDYSLIRPYGAPIKGFGGTACLVGETKVYKDRKKSEEENTITVKELFNIQERERQGKYRGRFQKIKIRSLDEDNEIFYRNNLIQVVDSGVSPVFEIRTKKGYTIKATANHRFMNYKKEWQFVSDFEVGDFIGVNGENKTANCVDCGKPISRRATRCVDCNDKNQIKENVLGTTARQRKECRNASRDYCEFCGETEVRFEIHHIDENPQNNHFSNLLNLCSKCHQRLHVIKRSYGNPYRHKYLSFDEIFFIEYIGEERVFDLQMEAPDHNFVANGFVSHNSGPEPLRELHKDIELLLKNRIDEELKSTDIVDIMNMVARAVVAGNVRRSAMIGFGFPEDIEYVTMKDSKKYKKELQDFRWASNNSIFAEVGKTDYEKLKSSIALNGEPGIVWLENAKKYGRLKDGEKWIDANICGTNPCGEIFLESTGLCNLVETFPSRHETYEEYQETLKYAYLYAKSVTLIPTHWPETNAVMMKNRRIGMSQTGIIDAFVRHGRREILQWSDKGYSYLRELDQLYSNWLCIPKSIKITTTKPSGSVSLLPGVSPGIHYPHSEYYIRRVRIASDSPLIEPLRKAGYQIEQSVYGSEETKKRTSVISFPVQEKYFIRKKEDATIWEQIKNVSDYQTYWSDNSVSVTVTFNKKEADDIPRVLEAYEDQLKAISFLPISEHGYEQAPYQSLTKEEYIRMSSKLTKAVFSGIITNPVGEKYCTNDVCEMPLRK